MFIHVPPEARIDNYKHDNLNLNLIFSYKSIDLNPSVGLRNKENSNHKFIWGIEFIKINEQKIEVLFDNKDSRDKFLEGLNSKTLT